jgi:probable selenium-dependent hydroxylase accessory protein YqeC
MKFYESLDILFAENELICFIGAGGKTTSLFKLAKELKECNKRVLVTTTTAIYLPGENLCDKVILGRIEDSNTVGKRIEPCICVLGREVTTENKLLGVEGEYIAKLFLEKAFDYLLVEADGSKQRSIKAPAGHEPVVPGCATKVVGVIGMDILGTPINSASVHRSEHFCRVVGRAMGERIDEEAIKRLILEPNGLFKGVPKQARKYVLLNKVDEKDLEKSAILIIEAAKKSSFDTQAFVIADMLKGSITKVL